MLNDQVPDDSLSPFNYEADMQSNMLCKVLMVSDPGSGRHYVL